VSDFLTSEAIASREPIDVFVRLVAAMLLGAIVSFVYRRTRMQPAPSFTVTLVLLTILIAMVTQVIGDNVARAFSLVGALSIVRFRTVVRDTQDTAYVIFAVAVGMAIGAGHPWFGIAGIVVIGAAAFALRERGDTAPLPVTHGGYHLLVRVGVGADPGSLLGPTLDEYLRTRRLQSVATSRQGLAVDVTYAADLRRDEAAPDLVKALNRLEGVQSVSLQRHEVEL
jgi:uncharacterized membrane protein YhiD involved in acid resistance